VDVRASVNHQCRDTGSASLRKVGIAAVVASGVGKDRAVHLRRSDAKAHPTVEEDWVKTMMVSSRSANETSARESKRTTVLEAPGVVAASVQAARRCRRRRRRVDPVSVGTADAASVSPVVVGVEDSGVVLALSELSVTDSAVALDGYQVRGGNLGDTGEKGEDGDSVEHLEVVGRCKSRSKR
jgi:hypothetical protein